jgi:Tol biopolymer transport system component
LAGLWIGRQGGASVARPAVRFDVPPPPGTTFLADFVEVVSLAVSPDGTRLAFVGVDVGVDAPGAQAAEQRPGARVPGTRVWLRNVADLEAAALPGTDGATSILWSPDGRSLAFFAGGRLRRVDLEGGSPVTICDLSPGIGYAGTWGPSGTILFASVQGDAIYSVPAAGGTATRLLVPDPSRHEGRIAWPQFLPDGRGFLFWARSSSKAATLMLADGGAAPRPVAAVNSRAAFVAPDWIVFARDGALLAQHFDAAGARLTGAPIAIAPAVPVFVSSGWAGFAASPSGSLLYLTGLTSSRLTWLDRTGTPQGTVGTPGNYLNVALSPDARSLLADRSQPELGTYDIWKFDLDRNVTTRITSDPDADFAPVWLPGTNSFVYSTIRGGDTGNPNLMRRNLDDGREEPVQPRNAFEQATDASLDGRLLTFIERDASGRLRNWVLELSGGRPPTELFHADDQVTSARFSPDARYVVYISAESGQGEAYVAPLSGAREPVRISQDGAAVVRWRHDGREILFLNRGRMTSVPVTTQPQLNLGVPRTLFTLPGGVEWTDFDVTPDGQRILAVQIERHAGTAPATAVVGWAPGSTR